MQIPVNQVVNVNPNAWSEKGLSSTTFLSSASQNRPIYMLHKPGNEPRVGDTLDGTFAPDKQGNLKFTRTPNPQYSGGYSGSSGNFQSSSTPLGTSSAASSTDPRQESIERQAYLKAMLDLFRLWKEHGGQDTPEVFVGKIVTLAQLLRSKMNEPAREIAPSGDILPNANDVLSLDNLNEVFGPGTAEVLNEGADGL
jgi:hypothetical protein